MSRHLTSKAIADSGELDQLRRQLGMHVKPKTSALAAMERVRIAAEERELIKRREELVKNMTEGELQMLAIFGWKDGEGAVAEPINKNEGA